MSRYVSIKREGEGYICGNYIWLFLAVICYQNPNWWGLCIAFYIIYTIDVISVVKKTDIKINTEIRYM